MSDAHDTPSQQVHPETPSTNTPMRPDPPTSTSTTAATDQQVSTGASVPPPTHPNIALGHASLQIDLSTLQPGNTAPAQPITGDEQIDPVLLALSSAQEQGRDGEEDQDAAGEIDIDLDEEGFDPDTLANLAALSRIAHEEDEAEEDEETMVADETTRTRQEDTPQAGPSRQPEAQKERKEQEKPTKESDASITPAKEDTKLKRKREPKDKDSRSQSAAPAQSSGDEGSEDEELRERSDSEGKSDQNDRFYYVNGKLRRKRNRTVLSCTECHRRHNPLLITLEHCDRNIPCDRCIRRGVPSMCRMEAPILPERKRRRPLEESPINYELGLRVQALESLIRAGTTMDADTANSAAMETILQATKAAGKGNVEAGNALAHLSSAAGMDMSEMESEERAELLMEVLQQLSAATVAKPADDEPALDPTDDPWSTVPRARTNMLSNQPVNTLLESDADNPQLDLTLHGFREDNGRIFVPPTVRYVEKRMRADQESVLAKDVLPIQGDERFLSEATKLAYGAESPAWRKGFVSAVQAHTITGALRIAASCLSRFPSSSTAGPRAVYVPTPTTIEDETALRNSGLEVRRFRFLDTETGAVDWEGAREDLMTAGPKSVVLIYVSGTVPTGVELNPSQWRLLTSVLLERQLLPLCVMPFQGLATGDPERDSQPVKFMVHEGLPVVLVQSVDAAMGIYADSPTIVSIATQSSETKERVDSHLRASARNFHSHPAPWGAQIVHAILSDSKLYPAWLNEIKAMSDRLKSVREKLFDILTNKLKTPGTWFHIKRSLGMQCTSLLTSSQVSSLALTRNIHLNPDGTFSLGALNAQRIDLLARGIDSIVRQSIREQEEAQTAKIAMEQALAAAREAAAKEEAEAAEKAAREAEEKAREEDTLLMEASIADAIEQQRKEEEEEKRREEERREMDEAIRKAAERADIARRAEEILASIGSI